MNKIHSAICCLAFLLAPLLPSNVMLRVAIVVAGIGLLARIGAPRPLTFGKAEVAFLLFILWSSFSLLWSSSETEAYALILDLCGVFSCFIVLSMNHYRIKTPEIYGRIYVFGCLLASVMVINNWFSGADFGGSGRYSIGDYVNSNYVAYSIATGYLVALYFIFSRKFALFGWVAVSIVLPLFLYAILLTGSRGAIISCLISTMAIVNSIKIRRARYKWLINVGLLCTLAGAVLLTPEEYYSRFLFESYDDAGAGYSAGRVDMWELAWTHHGNLMVGLGYDSFGFVTGVHLNPHNVLVSLIFELGAIGSVLYLATMLYFTKRRPAIGMSNIKAQWLPLILVLGWLPIALTGVWGLSPVAWMIFSWGRSMARVPPSD